MVTTREIVVLACEVLGAHEASSILYRDASVLQREGTAYVHGIMLRRGGGYAASGRGKDGRWFFYVPTVMVNEFKQCKQPDYIKVVENPSLGPTGFGYIRDYNGLLKVCTHLLQRLQDEGAVKVSTGEEKVQ
jgi:hypothetical protein